MSETGGGLQIVTGPVDGWCDPVSGVCHIGPAGRSDDRTAQPQVDGQEHGPVSGSTR